MLLKAEVCRKVSLNCVYQPGVWATKKGSECILHHLYLLLAHLAMVFDEYLRKKRETKGPRFSQTV